MTTPSVITPIEAHDYLRILNVLLASAVLGLVAPRLRFWAYLDQAERLRALGLTVLVLAVAITSLEAVYLDTPPRLRTPFFTLGLCLIGAGNLPTRPRKDRS